MENRVNHHCIICNTGYYHCNDCSRMKSFVPWRRVACSTECYQVYLAFMEYRDIDKDAAKFAEQVDFIGIDLEKLPETLLNVYNEGKVSKEAIESTEKTNYSRDKKAFNKRARKMK